MNIFDIIIVNLILLVFPIILWFFYVMYNKNIGRAEKELMFDFSLVTSLYLTIRFGYSIFDDKLFLIVNIPLFLAYFYKRNLGIIFLSLMITIYYYFNFESSLILLFLEYALYFGLYLLLSKKNEDSSLYIAFAKTVIFAISILLSQAINLTLIAKLSIIIVLNTFLTFIVIVICKASEDIIKYHMSLKELEQDKQFRSTLFRITHEIKNPIAVCKGYLDMFDVNNIKHSQKYVPILKEEIERTLILLQDFLSLTQIQIEYERIDVNAVLEDVVDNFIHIFKEKRIKYNIEIDSDSYYINGDYNRLTQVFINLIKNGIEALDPHRDGEISIKSESKGKFAIIYIQDNGVGFSESQMQKLGEPFYTTKSNGTGLGITLSREIIKAHNGEINYYSEYNKGTTVEIKLPLVD